MKPSTPTPPSHQSNVIHEVGETTSIATDSTSQAEQRPGLCRRDPAVAAGSPATDAVTPPARAPLPTKQPKANTAIKPTPSARGGPPPLPRLSVLPPTASKGTNMAAVDRPSPGPVPKMSMTSKEWIIPPRPKPGRKPATDTPPTKRKAQNRAAQRAFRERRAARVGELEQQLDEIKDDHHKEEMELKDKIHRLELDVQSFRSRCLLLENMLDRERQYRIHAEREADTLRKRHDDDLYRSQNMNGPGQSYSQSHNPTQHYLTRPTLSNGRPIPPAQDRNFSMSQIITPPLSLDISSNNPDADAAITCGNCSPNGPCACAEKVIASAVAAGCGKCSFGSPCQCMEDVLGQGQDLKRPVSPSAEWSDGGGKRQHRVSVEQNSITETDFTAIFSRQNLTHGTNAPEPSYDQSTSYSQVPSEGTMDFKDSCGFCKDGTYCVCAEDAAAGMATPAMTPTETLRPTSHQAQTPPPSEPDVFSTPMAVEMTADGAVKLPRRVGGKKPPTRAASFSSAAGGCGSNGPGTCAQCKADPKSGLFCRLMNAKYSREQGVLSGGCCGGKGAGDGCCKSRDAAPEKITLPSLPSLGLSCAEAYQTLSSHRNFSKAADDISSWLPKLKTTMPGTLGRGGPVPGRQAVEVEAASIMSVLKEFDIRFGRDA
ncbi:hypothetical protein E4U54_003269 [Claviceps lovelessii]|nr:hypothetical protein E4U54_003269 [Claviceps lovelessii]